MSLPRYRNKSFPTPNPATISYEMAKQEGIKETEKKISKWLQNLSGTIVQKDVYNEIADLIKQRLYEK